MPKPPKPMSDDPDGRRVAADCKNVTAVSTSKTVLLMRVRSRIRRIALLENLLIFSITRQAPPTVRGRPDGLLGNRGPASNLAGRLHPLFGNRCTPFLARSSSQSGFRVGRLH